MFIVLFSLLAIVTAQTSGGRKCSTLGDNVGLNATATYIDSAVDWSPRYVGRAGESELVYVVSRNRSLYVSSDDGVSWEGPINRNAQLMPPPKIGAATDVGGIHFTANPTKSFYVVGHAETLTYYWTTNDGGKSYKVNQNENSIVWITTHPNHANVALGFSYAQAYQKTFLTTNLGETWIQIGGNTTFMSQFACVAADCKAFDAVLYQNSDTEWRDCGDGSCTLMKQPFKHDVADSAQALVGTPATVFTGNDGLTQVHWPWYDNTARRIFFATQRIAPERAGALATQRLYYSSDGGASWTLAQFSFGSQPHHYQFITTEHDVLLAGVRDVSASEDADHGTLYVSSNGLEAGLFAPSLHHVRMSPREWWQETTFAGNLDVERSAELDGVLLANRYRANADGSPDLTCVQTVLTTDMGATWNLLPPPAGTTCPDGECHTHVRLDIEDFPTAYSPMDAVGLWLAQGNVGRCLSDKPEETYISNDSGKTWLVMSKERLIFEVSNHGALVAGAPTERLTNELTYTLDEGRTFQTCTFDLTNPGGEMLVNNILTRSFNAKNFILEGRVNQDRFAGGVLVHFEFDDVHERECGPDDYEEWRPNDGCLLGKHVVWQRRKPTAMCSNPIDKELTAKETICECTEKDFECDFCYERGPDGKCQPLPTQYCKTLREEPSIECLRPNVHEYVVSDGYRLQPNNVCKGGVQHGETRKCPPKADQAPAKSNTGAIVGAIVGIGLLIAGIVGVALYVYMKRRKDAQSYGTLQDSDDEI